MPAQDVQEKTIEACARKVWVASQKIWEEFETAAATQAAVKARSQGASEFKQRGVATKARHDAALARTPLVWEVFKKPGRMFGHWELAPAFPDGRLSPAERAEAGAEGNLIVNPGDGEADIAHKLGSLRQRTPENA